MNALSIQLVDGLRAGLITHGVPIVIILVLVILARTLSPIVFGHIIRRMVPRGHFHSAAAERQREDTLIRITVGTLNVLVYIVAALMLLAEVGVNIAPFLAAAGVAGLAIGFGAQYLIRDVVAGIFIILENQYRVGDVICLDGTCGLVEDISIRMVTLRDLDGTVHHVPHGTVSKTSNLSKDYARVNLDIGVAYSADLEEVIRVVNETGAALASDTAWGKDVVKPIQFERVEDFADSAIIVKILGETKPLRQWAVAGEYRKRLKVAFDTAGIEIPFPQRVVHTPTP
ncbi:mechanosensitive ion channel family protein [Candidatus Kaiserbacteria bacterium CG10_big_fil_rev_8_21_14_0_10_56_12]|uniref:Mechanosensitive ion channel family protein n=1 Tax=Candidatus Kaiserbacteria bacterium CG10_big_fil_rev_8_21_14_0_10_56_12 TaxID=1974611 RepID=A0A2H0U9G5_9BACT|nr:MAG: mechanosensitive ion channel family protein [Candidatus Kaiserbacteria bacterium CG10_big_fil_rev_8_21_14_0_10_56_12]